MNLYRLKCTKYVYGRHEEDFDCGYVIASGDNSVFNYISDEFFCHDLPEILGQVFSCLRLDQYIDIRGCYAESGVIIHPDDGDDDFRMYSWELVTELKLSEEVFLSIHRIAVILKDRS